MDSGVDSSLYPKCHHQIIYSKLNLKTEYPSPYIRKIWNYKKAETNLINRAIKNCDRPSLFFRKNVHQQVGIFKKTLLNIFYNYMPNKFILCDGKDPPWLNEEIKSLIHWKNTLFQRQRKSGGIDYTSLNALTPDISNAISSSKLKYHERLANKLNDPKTAPKTYWAILKTFTNGSKIPLIPPLLVDNKLGNREYDGEYLGLIGSFLSDRFQRVLLNGQTSKWSQIKAGVPQGSVLGPLLFLVYINDLPEGLNSNVKLFADDTSVFSVVRNSQVLHH